MTDYEKVERAIILNELNELIKKYPCPANYLEHSYILLSANDTTEAIMQLRKLQIKEETYEREIESFKKTFPDKEKEYLFLKNLYPQYKIFFNKKSQEEKDLGFYVSIIEEVIKSDCSIEEYCSITGKYKIRELNSIASKIKIKYPELYEKLEELNNKNKEQFYSYIKAIVIDIKINDKFDMLDYYYLTKLHPNDFLSIVKKIMPNLNNDILVKIKILMRTIDSKLNYKINKEQELNGTTIISNKEISKEEKERIFTFLQENNIPNIVYKIAIKRYADDEIKMLEYMGKEKIKK